MCTRLFLFSIYSLWTLDITHILITFHFLHYMYIHVCMYVMYVYFSNPCHPGHVPWRGVAVVLSNVKKCGKKLPNCTLIGSIYRVITEPPCLGRGHLFILQVNKSIRNETEFFHIIGYGNSLKGVVFRKIEIL